MADSSIINGRGNFIENKGIQKKVMLAALFTQGKE